MPLQRTRLRGASSSIRGSFRIVTLKRIECRAPRFTNNTDARQAMIQLDGIESTKEACWSCCPCLRRAHRPRHSCSGTQGNLLRCPGLSERAKRFGDVDVDPLPLVLAPYRSLDMLVASV